MRIPLHPPQHPKNPGIFTLHPFAIHASLTTLTIVILAASGVAIIAFIAAVSSALGRRGVKNRISSLVARLATEDLYPGQRDSMETVLARLESAAEHATGSVTDSTDEVSRLRSSLDAVGLGIVITDENGAVVFQNARAAALMESRSAELLAAQAVAEMLEAGVDGITSVRTIELYGPPRETLQVSTVVIVDHKKPLGVVAIVEDVSERKRLEAVRRDFVANVSHELKTPIGAMALLAETLEDENDLSIAKRLAGRIHGEAHRVSRIIDDLINLSRIEAEESPPTEPVHLGSVMDEAIDGTRAAAETRRITVVPSAAPAGAIVSGDRRELLSAVSNLIENSIYYSDPESTVWVDCTIDGDTVQLSVRDEGIGIPSRDLERIFERFYRVDQNRSRHNKGTGLGLSIVRHVINRHRGEVSLVSREGEGSTFTIRLPLHNAGGTSHWGERGFPRNDDDSRVDDEPGVDFGEFEDFDIVDDVDDVDQLDDGFDDGDEDAAAAREDDEVRGSAAETIDMPTPTPPYGTPIALVGDDGHIPVITDGRTGAGLADGSSYDPTVIPAPEARLFGT